jgi:hypothetical protein
MTNSETPRLRVLEAYSEPGGTTNEDRFFVSNRVAWVFDGATSLAEKVDGPPTPDAVWLVERLVNKLPSLQSLRLEEQLHALCATVAEDFTTISTGQTMAKFEVPTAVAVGIEVLDDSVEVIEFGDCQLILQSAGTDDIYVSPPTVLDDLDRQVLAAIATARSRHGLSPEQARRSVLPLLRQNRESVNGKEGYGAVSVFGDFPHPANRQTLPLAGPAHGILASDGFAALVTDYNAMAPADLLTMARKHGLSHLFGELRAIEAADSDATRFPRLKKHDDATAVLFAID